MTDRDRPSLGISLRILSGALFAAMIICVKAVGDDVPLGEVVFFRSVFAMIPLVIFLWIRHEFPQGLSTKRPLGHLVRASAGTLAMFAYFAAVTRLNLAEVVLIMQLSPILMALAAIVYLGERLTIWRIAGLSFGFTGVVVMVWPELGVNGTTDARLTGFLLSLASAVLTAIALVVVRSLNRTESPGAIAFYFVLASMIGALFTVYLGWVMPDGWALLLLVGAGLFGGFAHIAMTLAFRYAQATQLAPFEYLAILWPILADLLIFRLPLSTSFLLALPLVLLGAILPGAEKRKPV